MAGALQPEDEEERATQSRDCDPEGPPFARLQERDEHQRPDDQEETRDETGRPQEGNGELSALQRDAHPRTVRPRVHGR